MPLPECCCMTCFQSGIAQEWLSQYSITFSLMPSSILSLYASLHIRAQQETSSFSSIFTLNLVYLCSVFLKTWRIFDSVVTIQFLEVLRATIAVVIALRAALISFSLIFQMQKVQLLHFLLHSHMHFYF